jgi:hypothetical protein
MHGMPAQQAAAKQLPPAVTRAEGRVAGRAQGHPACGQDFGVRATGSGHPWGTTSIDLGGRRDPAP